MWGMLAEVQRNRCACIRTQTDLAILEDNWAIFTKTYIGFTLAPDSTVSDRTSETSGHRSRFVFQ